MMMRYTPLGGGTESPTKTTLDEPPPFRQG